MAFGLPQGEHMGTRTEVVATYRDWMAARETLESERLFGDDVAAERAAALKVRAAFMALVKAGVAS
jgi:hypothetical protein